MIAQVRAAYRTSLTCRSPRSKFDKIPEARPRVHRVPVGDGRLQILLVLRRAYTRGEEISRPFDDVIAEAYKLAGSACAINRRPERERLSRVVRGGGTADLATLITSSRASRHRPHPLHHVAPERVSRIRSWTRTERRQARELLLARAVWLRPRAGLMKRGYTAAQFVEESTR
jgi:hypothetical protein